ncbi:MAG: TraR/DksA family transcriptional regulator [Burkholderiales bacterium]
MALTPQQSEELKAIVEQRRDTLLRELGQDLDRMRSDGLEQVVGAVPDPGDESVQSLIQDLDQAEASRDLAELRTLDAARARLHEGSYGICSNCGQDIGFERLRAYPGAERCIRCQTQFEKTHGSPPRTTL